MQNTWLLQIPIKQNTKYIGADDILINIRVFLLNFLLSDWNALANFISL